MPDKQWHPLFVTAVREALSDARPGEVGIQAEAALSSKPLFVDVLVMKKQRTAQLAHPMASIFRRYNLFEYKSPEDYLAANDYYMGKACLYKALEHKELLTLEDFTLTFVNSQGYPREFFKMVRLRSDLRLEEDSPVPGIHQIYGTGLSVQVMVLDALTEPEAMYMFSPFLTGRKALRVDAAKLLFLKRRDNPDNPNVRELFDFKLRNNIMTQEEVEVLAQMIAQMSTDEKARIWKTLENSAWGREMIEKGKIQDKQEVIQEFLLRRFGGESPDIQPEVHQLNDLEVLHDVLKELFASSSLEEAMDIIATGIASQKK